MLRPTSNLLVAQAVLALVNVKLAGHEHQQAIEDAFSVKCYANGREQGYFLHGFPKKGGEKIGIAFSEYRSSDQVVVYVGPLNAFGNAGHLFTEKVYEEKRFFSCNNHNGAADYIVEQMVKAVTAKPKKRQTVSPSRK